MTIEGIIFDILNIMPYIKKHGKNPVTGQPLAAKDLLPVHFHKNTENQFICPITYKVFSQHSHIVALKPTGNVFLWSAIDDLCIQQKNMVDLVDGKTPFSLKDIITIQDPANPPVYEFTAFDHVVSGTSGEKASEAKAPAIAGNSIIRAVLAEVEEGKRADEEAAKEREQSRLEKEKESGAKKQVKLKSHGKGTTYHLAAGFTSSLYDVKTTQESEAYTEAELLKALLLFLHTLLFYYHYYYHFFYFYFYYLLLFLLLLFLLLLLFWY
jgi:peptidyl-prolyl cis-trans isomerase-like protein 2